MSQIELIDKIVDRCKGDVSFFFNDNRSSYCSVEKHLKEDHVKDRIEDVDEDVLNKMYELDKMIEIHFCPDTPVGFHTVMHYDLDLALQEVAEILEIK